MSKHSFETPMKNLESAVSKLDAGKLSLDEALECFENGINNANMCRSMLRNVQTRVETLIKQSDGNFIKEPFSAIDHQGED